MYGATGSRRSRFSLPEMAIHVKEDIKMSNWMKHASFAAVFLFVVSLSLSAILFYTVGHECESLFSSSDDKGGLSVSTILAS